VYFINSSGGVVRVFDESLSAFLLQPEKDTVINTISKNEMPRLIYKLVW
jgi:hypothetical protein